MNEKTQQEFTEASVRLREIFYDESLPNEIRKQADTDLKALTARYKAAFQPLSGTLPYTDDGRFDN